MGHAVTMTSNNAHSDTLGGVDRGIPVRRYLFVVVFATVLLINMRLMGLTDYKQGMSGTIRTEVLVDLKDAMMTIQQQSIATAALLSAELNARNSSERQRQASTTTTVRDEDDNTPIPLSQLVGKTIDTKCPNEHLQRLQDVVLPESVTTKDRRVLRIVHVTGKDRCVHKDVYEIHKKWLLDGHSFHYHDDAAVKRLLSRRLPEFPHLQEFASCLPSGAAMTDLWRHLLLWEYGGIYTDLDQAPGPRFNATTIAADDDAFLVPELGGHLAQYFIAISPRHPLMYFALQAALFGLYRVHDVGSQYAPRTTGPEAVRAGFKHSLWGLI